MDFYQGVVVEYLRADRAVFVNTECCIQLNPAANPDTSGPHWYCDAVACDFRSKTVFLCEMSYSKSLAALFKRLDGWHGAWSGVCAALQRDCLIPENWPVRPWLFVPEKFIQNVVTKLEQIGSARKGLLFKPRITPMEMVQPWVYGNSWNHRYTPPDKPSVIPQEMQS